MLRGKHFFVTYGWAPNNLCVDLRTQFVNYRAHAHSVGWILKEVALDEIFARAFELGIAAVEDLVDSSTAGADKCDERRQQFTTDEISQQKDADANEYLRTVYDNTVACNRLIRSLLPKKAVFNAVEQGTWPEYISKSCAQRLEAYVAVFAYLESRAYSNLEQLKSLQDSCLSMINLVLTKQGTAMNIIMQRFAFVTIIFAPLTLATGFFGMNVPIPGSSMNPDDHDRYACAVRSCLRFLLCPLTNFLLACNCLFTYQIRAAKSNRLLLLIHLFSNYVYFWSIFGFVLFCS